jgi:serpin B
VILLQNQEVESAVRDNAAFALDLFHQLKVNEGNLFFSPYSISVALAMTYAGARGNTAAQMAQTLHFTLEQARLHQAFATLEARLRSMQAKGHVKLGVANSLWPQKKYDFLPEFLALTREYYGVEITPLDYAHATEAARLIINEWVEAKTERKITNLIPPRILTDLTRLVLVNAIYFKGDWASQFDRQNTSDATFWVTSSESVTVPLMNQTREMRYAKRDGLQVLELPYAGDDLSMVVLLPDKVDRLDELQATLTAERLEMWTSKLRETEVTVLLPKFKMTGELRLDVALQEMGMADAFDTLKANFAGMDARPDWLYIAAVLHKAFVDLNEKGTEAAAATAVVMYGRAASIPPVNFRADHPFIFLIRDNTTRSILFLGRVVNPVSE